MPAEPDGSGSGPAGTGAVGGTVGAAGGGAVAPGAAPGPDAPVAEPGGHPRSRMDRRRADPLDPTQRRHPGHARTDTRGVHPVPVGRGHGPRIGAGRQPGPGHPPLRRAVADAAQGLPLPPGPGVVGRELVPAHRRARLHAPRCRSSPSPPVRPTGSSRCGRCCCEACPRSPGSPPSWSGWRWPSCSGPLRRWPSGTWCATCATRRWPTGPWCCGCSSPVRWSCPWCTPRAWPSCSAR